MVMLGVGRDFGPSQTESGDGQFICGRNGFRHCVSGSSLVFNCTGLCRFPSTSSSGRRPMRWWRRSRRFATFMPTVLRVSSSTAFSVRCWRSCLRFGPIAGALIGEFLGWQAIFITLAILAMLALLNAGFRWHETRPLDQVKTRRSVFADLRESGFWVYTVGFSAGMGTHFVFFSTAAPLLLIGHGIFRDRFSFAFATVALVMIVTTLRFAKSFVARWGIAGCVARGMALFVCGAVLLGIGELYGSPSFLTFIPPGCGLSRSVLSSRCPLPRTALWQSSTTSRDQRSRSTSAFKALIVSIVGTLAVALLNGDTAWPCDLLRHGDGGTGFVGAGVLRPVGLPPKSPVVNRTTGSRPARCGALTIETRNVGILSGRIPLILCSVHRRRRASEFSACGQGHLVSASARHSHSIVNKHTKPFSDNNLQELSGSVP